MTKIENQNNEIITFLEKFAKDKFPNKETKVVRIQENLYVVEGSNGNINVYLDNKGEVIANPGLISTYDHYSKLLELAGYEEKKDGKTYRMYRLKDGTEVNKYSLEYFQIWVDIDFYEGHRLAHLNINNRLSTSQFKILLPRLIETGSLRIKDIVPFFKRKQISDSDFKDALAKLQELLKVQTMDNRFERIKDEVTENEIEDYIKDLYISADQGNNLKSLIRQRIEKKNEKEIRKHEIHSKTQIEVSDITNA